MDAQIDSYLTTLYDSYGDNPTIKSLIHALTISGFPVGHVADTLIGTYVNNLKARRLKSFFEALNTGDVKLTEENINQNDFLHAYFSVVNYVIRTRSDEKIINFAKILKKICIGTIDINEFEDYTAIFNELSEREFAILEIKYQFEQIYATKAGDMNPKQLAMSYWQDFKNEVLAKINITEEEFEPLLLRMERTGCYSQFLGYMPHDFEPGHTTGLFKRIRSLIDQ